MQFERIHLDVFSTSPFATPAISPNWILKFKFHSFKTDTMWHKNEQTKLQKLLIFRDSHGPPTDLLERVIIFRHSRGRQLTFLRKCWSFLFNWGPPTDPFRCLDKIYTEKRVKYEKLRCVLSYMLCRLHTVYKIIHCVLLHCIHCVVLLRECQFITQ